MQRFLGEITGTAFELAPEPTGPGIDLSLAGAPGAPAEPSSRLRSKGLDAFVIRGAGDRLQIVANDERGLANGVSFYLEQIGVRWLLPGDRWTSVEHRGDIRLAIDRLVEPSYRVRDYAGTGGFYSWRWGRNFATSAKVEALTEMWKRRLRLGGEYMLGHAMGEAFIADRKITPVLAAHPEYLAKINGSFSPLYTRNARGEAELNVIAKINAGNPDAVALYCDWIADRLREARATSDAMRHAVVSVEPSDGYGYGDNLPELPGNGSGSDQTFFIANQCAKRVASIYPGASVILLAYAGHADVPSFPLEPNVIVQVTPYAFQPAEPEQFIRTWSTKAKRLAIYDYWSIPDWDWDEPSFDVLGVADKLRHWRGSGIEALNAESTYGAGAMGLGHYVAAHLMWDLGSDERALVAEWFERAFGPAQMPMRRMLERWAGSFRPISAELAASFRDMSEARRLAGADARIAGRLGDYARYLHYLRLRIEHAGTADPSERTRKAIGIARYLASIADTAMVHATRLIDLYSRMHPEIAADLRLDLKAPPGPGWSEVHPLSDAEALALIDDGVAAYPTADFEPRTWTGAMVPVGDMHWPLPAGSERWGQQFTTAGTVDLEIEVPRGLQALPLRVSRAVDTDVGITDGGGRSVFSHRVSAATRGTPTEKLATWDEFSAPLPPGRYRMRLRPVGGRIGYFSFQTLKGLPLTLGKFLSPKGFGATPRLYFWVPKGVPEVALYYPLPVSQVGPPPAILDPDGHAVVYEQRDSGKVLVAKVGPAQDGRIWSIDKSISPNDPMETLTVPQAFALSPDTLLVPAEALR